MTHGTRPTLRKVLLPATLLFGLGLVAGVAADRLWVAGEATELLAAPLTVESMVRALDLDTVEQARVAALLDTLEAAVAYAVGLGPDSLQAAARIARQRLEQALPPDVRPRFQSWMNDHHNRMMMDMRSGDMRRWTPIIEPETMRRWTPSDRGEWERMMTDDCCREGGR